MDEAGWNSQSYFSLQQQQQRDLSSAVAPFSLISLLKWNDSDNILIFIIIIIIIIPVIIFMQGIYNYIPETSHFSKIYSVAGLLYLQFVLHVMLFRPWNTFCTFTLALPAVCVQCPIWLFLCSSLISCFPGMLFRYCLRDFGKVPVAPIITGITFVFTFHMRWFFYYEVLYFKIFSAFFLITFPFPGIATSINTQVPSLIFLLWGLIF